MQNALGLCNWVVKGMRLVNMAGTLGQTDLLSLYYRSGNLGVVFLVSDIVDTRSCDRALRVCWLSWRLTIETKKVSQVLAELTSSRNAPICYCSASSFDWGCGTTDWLLLYHLLRQDHCGLNKTFLVELLECSWWMRRWSRWNDGRINSAKLSLCIFGGNTLWFMSLASLEKGGLLGCLWRYYFRNKLRWGAAEETAWNSAWYCSYTARLWLLGCGLLASKYSVEQRSLVLLAQWVS